MIVKPDTPIVDYITFKEDSLTVAYNGTAIVGLKTKMSVSVKITLVNDFGSNTYMQRVLIWPAAPKTLEQPSETDYALALTEDFLSEAPRDDQTPQEL